MGNFGKRMSEARASFEGKENLSVEEAVALVKGNAKAKFDETIEIAMNLGVDTRHADQMVRGVVGLPNGTGKSVRVAVFARDAKADEAKAAGADVVGFEDLAGSMQAGEMDFDVVVATPDAMPVVSKLGKVLGPRGLMPNPKVGTVSKDVEKAVKNAKSGQVQYRTDKAGIVHCAIGKVEFTEEMLAENLRALITEVVKAKPSTAKGKYLKKISLSSSMGPSLLVDGASYT